MFSTQYSTDRWALFTRNFNTCTKLCRPCASEGIFRSLRSIQKPSYRMLEVYMTLSQNPWNIPVHGCSWACECPRELEKYIHTGRVQKLNHCSACSASAITLHPKTILLLSWIKYKIYKLAGCDCAFIGPMAHTMLLVTRGFPESNQNMARMQTCVHPS